jgi:hypothetical protein
MLSLLLWCVFGLLFYPKHDTVFLVMTAAVTGMFFFGALLLGSVKFAHFFFDLGARFAPGKLKEKFRLYLANSLGPGPVVFEEMIKRFHGEKRRKLAMKRGIAKLSHGKSTDDVMRELRGRAPGDPVDESQL